MKKTIILSLAAAALFCACQKENARNAEVADVEFTIGADIDDANKTAFVPGSNKIYWLAGDKLGLKYTKTAETIGKNDNVELTLNTGAGTCSGTFKGKLTTSSAVPTGDVLVFYYPKVSAVAKSGSINDKDDFILGGNFPKVQNTNDVAFDPNLMYGFVTDVQGWPTTTEAESPLNVTMKNVMSVIDFTLKGAGSVKRLFITDLNPTAPGMTGDYTVQITNGEFAYFDSLPAGTKECDRTITAEFPKPIELSAAGVHVYVTVMPRKYSKGIKVGLELTNGDYMVDSTTTSFTTVSNKVYTAAELTFKAAEEDNTGIYENAIYKYETFIDGRDGESYRYVTMADGNDWMIDNLRYLPEGYEPSSTLSECNNGVWYPVLMNSTGTGLAFSTAEADIDRFGYIYNPAVAFGQDASAIRDMIIAIDIAPQTMTAAEALTELKSWDNTGICPEGWHIPTADEYTTMAKNYVTAMTDVSLLSILGQQGFSLKDFGYMMVAAPTAAKLDPAGTLQTFTGGKLNSTYLLLSTPTPGTGAKINDWNKGFQAVMTNVSSNTANTANMLARSGAAVRCIRAAK